MITARAVDLASFRDVARRLLHSEIVPADVQWDDGVQSSLFGGLGEAPKATSGTSSVPPEYLERAEIASMHSARDRFAVLYRLLWKLTHGSSRVLSDPLDEDVTRLATLLREVHEEEHRMHAFVRFRRTDTPSGEHWIAWYRPAHPVLRLVAPFFARRYPNMRWTLFTPEQSAHWDGELHFGPGAPGDAPAPDELDALFLTYYSSVFNPARTNVSLLHRHIPHHARVQLPEASAMQTLAREASTRVRKMATRTSASAALLPVVRDLESLSAAACSCRACPIGEHATQTVFGEGPRNARLMIVGEQPGDEEDREGRPFIGPAGRLLDELLLKVGLPRAETYVTNAVKHFKWEPRGKRRLHAKPRAQEIEACRGWLLAEVDAIKPEMILCLGATAAQSFAGAGFRVQRDRGKPIATPWAPWWMATYHPSALLRAGDEATRRVMESEVLADLARARDRLALARSGEGRATT